MISHPAPAIIHNLNDANLLNPGAASYRFPVIHSHLGKQSSQERTEEEDCLLLDFPTTLQKTSQNSRGRGNVAFINSKT
jgi:hypothetical protein